MGGIYNLAIRRNAPKAVLDKVLKAFTAAVNSDTFKAVAKKKYFTIDVRSGAEADKNAAQMEVLTANTFSKLGIKGSVGADKLGLPSPAKFDSWWPPKGYKPRM